MLKRIQVLEDGRVPATEARSWRIEGPQRRITRKEYQRLLNKFEMEGCIAQKGLGNLVREKVLQDRRELPKEEGDVIREYKSFERSEWDGECWKKMCRFCFCEGF